MPEHRRIRTWSSVFSLNGIRSLSLTGSRQGLSSSKSFLSRLHHRRSSSKLPIDTSHEDTTAVSMSDDAIIAVMEHLQPRASSRPANIQTSSTGPCTFSFQDSRIVEGEQHRAKRYLSGVNPLACHTDVCAFAQPPGEVPVTRATPPRIYVDHDDDDNIIGEAVIYSPSIGDLTSYARQTPSPARSSYDSRDMMERDGGDASSENKNIGDHTKDSSGITRSITGLFAKLGSKKDKGKDKLTSTPTSTSLSEPEEKPVDISPRSHTPQKPSPLRKVQSADSLTSLDKELLRNY